MKTEREKFEAFYAAYKVPLEAGWFKRHAINTELYADDCVDDAWEIWQACAESKDDEIDALKAENAKLRSREGSHE